MANNIIHEDYFIRINCLLAGIKSGLNEAITENNKFHFEKIGSITSSNIIDDLDRVIKSMEYLRKEFQAELSRKNIDSLLNNCDTVYRIFPKVGDHVLEFMRPEGKDDMLRDKIFKSVETKYIELVSLLFTTVKIIFDHVVSGSKGKFERIPLTPKFHDILDTVNHYLLARDFLIDKKKGIAIETEDGGLKLLYSGDAPIKVLASFYEWCDNNNLWNPAYCLTERARAILHHFGLPITEASLKMFEGGYRDNGFIEDIIPAGKKTSKTYL